MLLQAGHSLSGKNQVDPFAPFHEENGEQTNNSAIAAAESHSNLVLSNQPRFTYRAISRL